MAAFEVIDIRSFSNLWFWMVLAVMWSSASHRVIGIPYDMIQNAKRHGGQAERDLEGLMQINARRFFASVSFLIAISILSICLLGLPLKFCLIKASSAIASIEKLSP